MRGDSGRSLRFTGGACQREMVLYGQRDQNVRKGDSNPLTYSAYSGTLFPTLTFASKEVGSEVDFLNRSRLG